MTKGVLIESAYLSIMGGELTQDANVRREDLNAYLPTAVARAWKQEMFGDRAEARAEVSVNGFGSFSPSPEFYSEVVITPVKNDVTCAYSATLPKLLDLPNNWNVLNARPVASFDIDYIRVTSHRDAIGLEGLGPVFYWVTNTASRTVANFVDLPVPIQDIVFTVAISPEALALTDEVPYPPSVLNTAINMMVAYFRQQRSVPADAELDGNDINDSPMPMGRK